MATINSGERLRRPRYSMFGPGKPSKATDINVSFTKEFFRRNSVLKRSPGNSLGPGNNSYR